MGYVPPTNSDARQCTTASTRFGRPQAELRGFAGRYTRDEVNNTLQLLIDGDTLVVRRAPDWDLRLTPVYADAFRGDLGWITFERDASGQVIRLNVSQDRMWRLPFDRR